MKVIYSDGKDYSYLKSNSPGFNENASEGNFDGICVEYGSDNITITDAFGLDLNFNADICHDCGYVYK